MQASSHPNPSPLIPQKNGADCRNAQKKDNQGFDSFTITGIAAIILSMLSLKESTYVRLLNKIWHCNVDFYYKQTQLTFTLAYRQQRQEIEKVEEKKRQELISNQSELELQQAQAVKTLDNQKKMLEQQGALNFAELERRFKKSKEDIEKKAQKSIDEISSNRKANNLEIDFIREQVTQLSGFLADAKKEKGKKSQFSKRVIHGPVSTLSPLWDCAALLLYLSVISLVGSLMGFCALFPWSAGTVLTAFDVALIASAWPVFLGGLGISVCLLLMAYCITYISFDQRGVERFDDALLLSFSKQLYSSLVATENIFLPLACFTVCAISSDVKSELLLSPENKTADNKNQNKVSDKIYIEVKDQILKYQIFEAERSVTAEEMKKILGEQKTKEMFQALEAKPTAETLGKYKKEILKIISSKGDIENPFARVNINTVTLGEACEIVQKEHESLLAKLSVFQKREPIVDSKALAENAVRSLRS